MSDTHEVSLFCTIGDQQGIAAAQAHVTANGWTERQVRFQINEYVTIWQRRGQNVFGN